MADTPEPLLTVIMPVYNAEKYVQEAVQSIVQQSYRHFELLIFNDCSTDRSRELILAFKDERIRLIDSQVNTGYVKHLNDGLKMAKGKYIVRMDADDVSMPGRLMKQLAFMEAHPEVGVCGSWIRFAGTREEVLEYPVEHRRICTQLLLFGNAIAHPSVMIRKQVLDRYLLQYNAALEPAEDYDLWVRMSDHTQLHNLPEVLLHYRVHDRNESVLKKEKQDAAVRHTRKRLVGEDDPVWSFMNNRLQESRITSSDLHQLRRHVKKLLRSERYDNRWLRTETTHRFVTWCRQAPLPGYVKIFHYTLFPRHLFSIRICLSLLVHSRIA